MRRRCPVCRKVIDKAELNQSRGENFYPFCCNRCKLIDLGQWLDGNYKIVSEIKAEEEEGKNSGQTEVKGDNNCEFRCERN
jgi:endogenous inhibitor of DNA gyrase (YacG/DUF329 family)